MAFILKIAADEESAERELEFELKYQRRLTTQQRFEMMWRRSREMVELLHRHGHRNPPEIIKRP